MVLGEAVKGYIKDSIKRKGLGSSGSGFRDALDRQVRYYFSTITRYVPCAMPRTIQEYIKQQVMETFKDLPSVVVNFNSGAVDIKSGSAVVRAIPTSGIIRIASLNPPLGYIGDQVVAFGHVRPVKIGGTYPYTKYGNSIIVQGEFEGKIGKAMRYPIPYILSGFICSPRSHDHFKATEYMPETEFQESKRTYTIQGGWAHDEDKKLYQLETTDIIYPQDASRAALVLSKNGTDFSGKFLADEEPRFGNFYAINPRDDRKILTWMGTPTRHGALYYSRDFHIPGVVSTEESVGFGTDIYRSGRLAMKGPKINDYSTQNHTNQYAIVLACCWTMLDDVEHVIIIASYTHIPESGPAARRLGVFTTTGSPIDGDMYDEEDHPRGWIQRFYTNKSQFNLPWFISDDGKYAVCSDGDTLDMSSIDAISYSNYTRNQTTPSFAIDGDVDWGFEYSDNRCISEEAAGTRVSLPITLSSTMTKGQRINDSSVNMKTEIEIRGPKPDECLNGVLFYNGKPWWNPGCPADFISDDPMPDRKCTSCLDGETYRITLTGTGVLTGITCSILKFIPYGAGQWVRTACAITDFDCCAPYAECFDSVASQSCTEIHLECWRVRGVTYYNGGWCVHDSESHDYFAIRDWTLYQSGSGRCLPSLPDHPDEDPFTYEVYTFVALIATATFTYICDE